MANIYAQLGATNFGDLYRAYHSFVTKVAQKLVKKTELAEDIAQAVFLKAFEKIDYFSVPPECPPQALFKSWLYVVTTNEARDYFRQLKKGTDYANRAAIETELERPPTPEILLMERHRVEQRRKKVERFIDEVVAEPRRRVTRLRFLEELSHEEICRSENLTPNALYAKISRARQQMEENAEMLKEKE